MIADPTRRLVKKTPNHSENVKRFFISVLTVKINTIIHDVINMSFRKYRPSIIGLPSPRFSYNKCAFIIFGAARIYEFNEMGLLNYSYIAVVPESDYSTSKLLSDQDRDVCRGLEVL